MEHLYYPPIREDEDTKVQGTGRYVFRSARDSVRYIVALRSKRDRWSLPLFKPEQLLVEFAETFEKRVHLQVGAPALRASVDQSEYVTLIVNSDEAAGARGNVDGWGTNATSRKAAGSIPGVGVEFFNWPNPSSRIMSLGSAQLLTEMSTRNLPGGKGRPERKSDNLTAISEPIV
jgi:hypothetical protein